MILVELTLGIPYTSHKVAFYEVTWYFIATDTYLPFPFKGPTPFLLEAHSLVETSEQVIITQRDECFDRRSRGCSENTVEGHLDLQKAVGDRRTSREK